MLEKEFEEYQTPTEDLPLPRLLVLSSWKRVTPASLVVG
jgi:hypothetical protein